ncbi:hypothetical protein [Streptomyces fulvoviolaceus]|uniref:hypothetical protein n=1 Tax=Streptomyces fulvoviolaceus TaxID=285535 RepID=UPI0021C21CE5|nr:hypothetical protein [Streptomyces fulvoviolaceus]MCT9076618.1 hypothetical protein [Streptomyces fulvoviolaceus]
MGRATRRVANGCLVLLIVPACLVAYFWYTVWHAGHVNSEREEDALASVLQGAREDGDGTARALAASRSTGTDALTGLVWQHTEAPLITYDSARRAFTATAFRSAVYDEEALLFVHGGPTQVQRCLGFVYTRRADRTWTSKVTVRDDAVCRPSERIRSLTELARTRITNMYAADLTRTGVRQALDPAFDVREVVRKGETATVDVLVHDDVNLPATVEQCYRFTRSIDPDDGEHSATVVAATTC